MHVAFTVLMAVSWSCVADAQTFETALFQVPSDPNGFQQMREYPGRLEYRNVNLGSLVAEAFDTGGFPVVVPASMKNQRYDLIARVPGKVTRAEKQQMLKQLLNDQLKLQTHHEQQERPVYILTVGKKGSRLKEVPKPEAPVRPDLQRRATSTRVEGIMPIDQLLSYLRTDHLILDRTNLGGYYEIKLNWSTREDEETTLPGLAQALETDLGLHLQPAKVNVSVVVVDHAEKVPIQP
jgi:uncharacterized protein (TIGR03435 family)